VLAIAEGVWNDGRVGSAHGKDAGPHDPAGSTRRSVTCRSLDMVALREKRGTPVIGC
jgi:hypothetical protein